MTSSSKVYVSITIEMVPMRCSPKPRARRGARRDIARFEQRIDPIVSLSPTELGLAEFGTVGLIKPACWSRRGHNPAATIPPSWRESAVAALISLAPRIRARTKAADEPSTVNPRAGPIGPAA
jgi:hypothetical protein